MLIADGQSPLRSTSFAGAILAAAQRRELLLRAGWPL
jgi:hypothetical protein